MVRRFGDPEPLTPDDVLEGFDCGRASMNVWLARYARQGAAVGSARTYVVVDAQQARVVGYHALTAGQLEREAATARVIRGMPQYPSPVVLLARLAVDRSVAGRGLGRWLLRDAMLRTLAASETLGDQGHCSSTPSMRARARSTSATGSSPRPPIGFI